MAEHPIVARMSELAAQLEGEGVNFLEAVCELTGLEPSDENADVIVEACTRSLGRAPSMMASLGSVPYAVAASGMMAGVEFAIAARQVLESDPRG